MSPVIRVRSLITIAVTTAVAATSVIAALPAQGARERGPDGQPRPQRAAALPSLPDVPSAWPKGKVTPRSIPGAASVGLGTWITWPEGANGRTGVEVRLPAGGGIPLMGDWDGDGVLTPGRFEGGQWFITNAAVDSPQWQSYATFGEAGDAPVVGFIDGDRRSDIGVFRNGTWLWQTTKGQAPPPVTFGRAGDIPVVGDWDGTGGANLGYVRDGRWTLRVGSEGATRSLAFGSAGDIPVVGDWNRDGSDDPGVVQDRRTWVLSGGVGRLRPTAKEIHPLAPAEVPIVGSQATAPDHCPTATRDGERLGKELAAHGRDARALQLRWKDGHMYADGTAEESYRLGKEEYALQQIALAWWAGAVKEGLPMQVDRTAYPGISLGVGTPLP